MNDFAGPQISVLAPLDAAIERVRLILFQPFALTKWLIIGFCAWLAELTRPASPLSYYSWDARSTEHIRHEIVQNLPVILVVASVVITVGLAIIIVLSWLTSRGQFMFLHCVAENRAEVKLPWSKYRSQGNSLFLFRLALGFIALFCFGLLTAATVVLGIVFGRAADPMPLLMVAAGAIPVLLTIALTFALVQKFTKDFVVPLMVLRNCTCTMA